MVRQTHNYSIPQSSNGRALNRVTGVFVDDLENRFERDAFGLLLLPSGQQLGYGIQKCDSTLVVGSHDRIANTGERDTAPLRLEMQGLLRRLRRLSATRLRHRTIFRMFAF